MNEERKEYIVNNYEQQLEMLKTVKDGDLVTYKYSNNNITVIWLDLLDKPSNLILKIINNEIK